MSSGLLNLAKPSGVTSRRVVDGVARIVRPARCGHAGTLDPLAEGVLVVCVGAATRLIEYVQRLPKRYRGTFILGATSPTEDTDGAWTRLSDPPIPTLEALADAARQFLGPISQRPPAYSAKKVAGRRAYDLARSGREVELEPTIVEIHRLEVASYDYPQLALEVECGSGTYIRSLGRDLARALGTDAVMSALVRTAIGPFTLETAVPMDSLTAEIAAARMLPPVEAVRSLPRLELSADDARRLLLGQSLFRPDTSGASSVGEEFAAIGPGGQLVAIVARLEEGRIKPLKVMPRDEFLQEPPE